MLKRGNAVNSQARFYIFPPLRIFCLVETGLQKASLLKAENFKLESNSADKKTAGFFANLKKILRFPFYMNEGRLSIEREAFRKTIKVCIRFT